MYNKNSANHTYWEQCKAPRLCMICATLFSNINHQITNSNEKINYLGIRVVELGLVGVVYEIAYC